MSDIKEIVGTSPILNEKPKLGQHFAEDACPNCHHQHTKSDGSCEYYDPITSKFCDCNLQFKPRVLVRS